MIDNFLDINIHLHRFFIESNRASCARLYFYIKSTFNNHFHSDNIEQTCSDLQISKHNLYRTLSQLQDLGISSKYSKGYWRINSWKTWCPTLHENSILGIQKNRKVSITLDQLRDLKFMRTLYYTLLYKASTQSAKKNRRSKRASMQNKSSHYFTSGDFLPSSASFVQAVTSTPFSLSSINKHLHRARNYSLLDFKNDFEVLGKFDLLAHAREFKKFKQEFQVKTIFIRFIKSKFYVFLKKSNLVSVWI